MIPVVHATVFLTNFSASLARVVFFTDFVSSSQRADGRESKTKFSIGSDAGLQTMTPTISPVWLKNAYTSKVRSKTYSILTNKDGAGFDG